MDMRKCRIAKIALPSVLNKEFDYSFPPEFDLKKGMRVLVDFRGRKRLGLVCATLAHSAYNRLKTVIKPLDSFPVLHKEHFQFARRLGKMYPYAYSEFLFMMLPPPLKKARPVQDLTQPLAVQLPRVGNQRIFVKAGYFWQRYEYWRELVREKLQEGSVLVCFPQLSYLRQAQQYFEKDFHRSVIVMHSQLSQKQLWQAWVQSRQKALILGSRVSLFYYPLDLQLLIIEAESSPYYFQEEKPYHNLFDVALLLADLKKIDVIASGDYPSLTCYGQIREKKMRLVELVSPAVRIDIVSREKTRKANIISPVAIELLRKSLCDKKQAVILWSKKGFSRVTACSHCKHVYTCQRCSGFLQLSAIGDEAVCPYCPKRLTVPKICPYCRNGYIQSRGWGIERLGTVLARLFPQARIDTWPQHSAHSQFILSTPKILSGLYADQRFHRGLDLDADSHLMRMDYNATFNAYLYFKQVSLLFSEAFHIFTYNKAYYLFDYLNGPWQAFYERELALRKKMNLPPYAYLIKISLRSCREKVLFSAAQNLYNRLQVSFGEVYGPLKEYPFRIRDQFRYALIVKTKKKPSARTVIKREITGIRSSLIRVAVTVH